MKRQIIISCLYKRNHIHALCSCYHFKKGTTIEGIIFDMDVKDEHPEKALYPIVVMEEGRCMDAKDEHL
eukprot:2376924-Ditylum_brightwellii.AAC.1